MSKSWGELTDLEKREATALLLGWLWLGRDDGSFGICGLGLFPPEAEGQKEWCGTVGPLIRCQPDRFALRLPDWPTNDGRAFTEVWPKILEFDAGAALMLTRDGLPMCYSRIMAGGPFGVTWADVIGHAAYELLEKR